MHSTATIIEAHFRSRGYTEGERVLLRDVLSEVGAVRLRPLDLPEAGGSTELYLVLSFVGGAIATGLVEHITGKVFDKLCDGLTSFVQTRTQRDGTEPEMTLRVSYDDVDLDIGPVESSDLKHVPLLAQVIRTKLAGEPLKALDVTRIVIGMVRHGDEWSEPHLWDRSDEGQRFWGISTEGHRAVTHLLDTETGLLSERPQISESDLG